MYARAVSATDRSLLPAIRSVLRGVEEAWLCVAFVDRRGVHLVDGELRAVHTGGRLLATTVFGTTQDAALAQAAAHGGHVRVLNRRGGTYHPKVFLGRRGAELEAVVGSANLTGGLVSNVEAGVHLQGRADDPELGRLLAWCTQWWAEGAVYTPSPIAAESHPPSPLWNALTASVRADPVVRTLSEDRPNLVTEVNALGMWVETHTSRAKGSGPQEVPAWMIELALETLQARGQLTNEALLTELRVHRSSFVCALLARLPQVVVASRKPITLAWNG